MSQSLIEAIEIKINLPAFSLMLYRTRDTISGEMVRTTVGLKIDALMGAKTALQLQCPVSI